MRLAEGPFFFTPTVLSSFWACIATQVYTAIPAGDRPARCGGPDYLPWSGRVRTGTGAVLAHQLYHGNGVGGNAALWVEV